jgi:hypothetical protein
LRGLVIEHLAQRLGELVDVPIGVNVPGRLDAFVAEELLDGLQVPSLVEDALDPREKHFEPERPLPEVARHRSR